MACLEWDIRWLFAVRLKEDYYIISNGCGDTRYGID